MAENKIIVYLIKDLVELNLSYMPFINNGGLFIPSYDTYTLGDELTLELYLPTKKESMLIEGKVVWITPKNALHHVIAGIGMQFIGANASTNKTQIEASLDKSMEVGGYTYGMTAEQNVKR